MGACRWNWCGSIPVELTNQLYKLAGGVLSARHSVTIISPLRLQINLLGFAEVCDNLEPSLRAAGVPVPSGRPLWDLPFPLSWTNGTPARGESTSESVGIFILTEIHPLLPPQGGGAGF